MKRWLWWVVAFGRTPPRQWYRCLVCGNEQDLGSWCARCDEEDNKGVLVVPTVER